ncbi:MAG: ExbD/TolR family protein [Phycisphaeraceae bacterium JB051]
MRIELTSEDDAQVPLSPVIDCVFLLLIFFLVTTMLKFKEKQIPITLPDPTTSLSEDANSDIYVIGVDEKGQYFKVAGANRNGSRKWERLDDLAGFLKKLGKIRGKDRPLQFAADRDTPFQTVIKALDIAQLQQYTNVEVKTRNPAK